jgi:hypothetical protein
MANPSNSAVQNLLPVQAYFDVYGNFVTFIGQGQPFSPPLTGTAAITGGTINGTTIGATVPSTGVFTNIATTTGTISTTPSGSTDIANKLYVDNVAQGLDAKASCVCATTTNLASLSGLLTIDGIVTVAGDRVLVKNQTAAADNGIYVAASGAWARSADMTTWAQVPSAYVFIEKGTTQADTGWVCIADQAGVIGVTAMNWTQFSGAGTYSAGTGLTLTGTVFSLTNPVTVALGGTGGIATATAGAVAYGTGTIYAFTAAGTSGQVLQSNGASAPSWVTPTAYATITDDTTTNAVRYPLFSAATSGSISTEYTSSTKFQFNPSTGTLTATIFSGAGTSLTGVGLLATAGTYTALQTFTGSSSVAALKTTNIKEVATVSATAATGTVNFDITTQSVLYYTSSASGNWTLNFRGSSGTSLDTLMATGESMSATHIVTQGATAYYNSAITVDGTTPTVKWQGGTAPTSGNASSIDSYTYVIIKTATATFTVLASQTKFA